MTSNVLTICIITINIVVLRQWVKCISIYWNTKLSINAPFVFSFNFRFISHLKKYPVMKFVLWKRCRTILTYM